MRVRQQVKCGLEVSSRMILVPKISAKFRWAQTNGGAKQRCLRWGGGKVGFFDQYLVISQKRY